MLSSKEMGASKVLTIGTFDLLHIGHIELFHWMKRFGNEMLVGVNADKFVQTFKNAPFQNYSQRCKNINRIFDCTIYKNNSSGKDLILKLNPDVLVVGMDWASDKYFDQINMSPEEFNQYNIALVFVPRTTGVSSSQLYSPMRSRLSRKDKEQVASTDVECRRP